MAACGYYQKFIELDEVNDWAWILSLAALTIVGLPIINAVTDEYDKSSKYTQLNAIVLATILNIAAFIVTGMYLSVII